MSPPTKRMVFLAVAFCAFVFVVAALTLNVYGRSKKSAALQEAYALGGPVTFEEILAVRPASSKNPTGAQVLLALTPAGPEVDAAAKPLPFVGEAESPGLGHRWSEETHQAAHRYLALVAAQLDQINRLKDLDPGAFPFLLTGSPEQLVQTELPRLAQTRHAVKIKSLDVVSRAMSGDNSRLADDLEILFRHGEIAANTPLLISYLSAIACDSLAISDVEKAMALTSVPADQLSRMQAILDRHQEDARLAQALRGERAYTIAFFNSARSPSGFGGLRSLLPGFRGWLLCDLGFGIRLYNQLIPAAQDPSKRHLVQSVSSTAQNSPGSIVALSIPPLVKSFELEARRLADCRCALAAIAAERYRLAKGHWPARLNDLMPDFLDAVPSDPYAPDQPLRSAELQDRFVIYSVGPNGQDDHGNVRRGKDSASATDYGFILLSPEARHQPPVPESRPATTISE